MKVNNSTLFDFSKYKTKKNKDFENQLIYAEIQAEIAKTIIEYRNKNNLTQKDLSDILDVNQSMIAKLEKGNYNPSIKFLFELSNKISDDYSFLNSVLVRIQKLLADKVGNDFYYNDVDDIVTYKVSEDDEKYDV